MHVRTMDLIVEYNNVMWAKNKLALRVKEIAAKKNQLMTDYKLQGSIENLAALCEQQSAMDYDAIVEIGNKFGIKIRSQDDIGEFWKLQRDPEKLRAFVAECGELLLHFNGESMVMSMYESYTQKHELRKDCKSNGKAWGNIILGLAGNENLREVHQNECEHMHKFMCLLEQFKANEDELKALTVEGKDKLREIKKFDGKLHQLSSKVREYAEWTATYCKTEKYRTAQTSAQNLASILDENRTKLLSSVTDELSALKPKYDALQSSTKTALGKDYEQMFQAYVMLKSVAGSSKYVDVLSAKKDLLDSRRNDNPEKAVGLFRKSITDSGYDLDKRDAAEALAAVRRLNEAAAISLQNLVELDYKVSELAEKKDALSGKIF